MKNPLGRWFRREVRPLPPPFAPSAAPVLAPPAPEDPFDGIWRLLSAEPAAGSPGGMEPAQVEQLASQVLAHFARNRPAPTVVPAMAVAFAASQAAFELHVGQPDRVFLAGMFNDVGKSLALRSLAALTSAGEVPPELPAPVVDDVLERTHVVVGCDLHRIWGLPPRLAELCRDQHLPEVPDDLEHQDLHLLRTVSGLHRLVLDPADTRRLGETRQSLQALRLDRRGAKRLHKELAAQAERVALLFPD